MSDYENEPQPHHSDLRRFRSVFDLSQATFASQMGMPIRTYEDLEGGGARVKSVHIRAAEMALLQLAYDRREFTPLPEKLKIIMRAFQTAHEDANQTQESRVIHSLDEAPGGGFQKRLR